MKAIINEQPVGKPENVFHFVFKKKNCFLEENVKIEKNYNNIIEKTNSNKRTRTITAGIVIIAMRLAKLINQKT